jgi:hypothetical protein
MKTNFYPASMRIIGTLSVFLFTLTFFSKSGLLHGQIMTFEGNEVLFKNDLLVTSFKSYEVYKLDSRSIYNATNDKNGLDFILKLGDRHVWPITLSKHDITTHDFQELTTDDTGNIIVLPKRKTETYKGYVTPKFGTDGNYQKVSESDVSELPEVRMSIRENYIIGYITDGDRLLFIEPLNYSLKNAPNDYYLLYDPEDVLKDPTLTCGVLDVKNRMPIQHDHLYQHNTSKALASQCVEVRLLLAATFDMVNLLGSVNAVNNRMQDITNLMAPFYNFAGLNYVISQIFTPNSEANDPFTDSADAVPMLNSIETWAAGVGILPHGIGQLWTARDIFGCSGSGTSLIGCAWIGVVCESNRYNVNEHFTNNISCLSLLSAHELGHNWNCEHSDAEGNSINIMFPSLNCGALPTGFSSTSMAVINTHINSRTCLDDCGVPANDLCAGAINITCGQTFNGSTFVSTSNDAPTGCADGGFPNEGVWIRFTGNGQVATISTAGSSFDTQINIYSGTCGNLTCVGGDDDSGPGLTSSFTFCTSNGVQYFVYIDGFAGSTGNYTINLSCVNDMVPPMITCPVSVNISNDPGDCGAIVTYPPATATDNCAIQSVTYTQNTGTFFPVGISVVTAIATDPSGNAASCQFNVTVVDNEAPTIICSNGSVVFNGDDEHILDPDDYTVYDDNCGIQSVILDPPVITCDDLGANLIVIATVTDIYGNTAVCAFNLEVLGLPCGWSFTPDGINCTDGNDVSYSVPLDEFYVESTNCYFAHPFNSDVMGFAQYELCGDGSITAHVTDISGNALGWAGVSMRENNNGGAKKVQLMTNRSNLSRREVRSVTNGSSTPQQFLSFNRYWLRLTRSGNQFSGYVSNNGMNWFYVMAATVAMPECIQIGLVVTNYNSSSTVTATFANVVVDENMMMMPVTNWDDFQSVSNDQTSISVFPNPTSGELFIDLSKFNQDEVDIITLDPLGRIVGRKLINTVQDNLEILNLQDYSPGVYYLKFIVNNNEIHTQKVIYSGR